MVKRGEPPQPRGKHNPTLGMIISRWDMLLLSCHDCTPQGRKHDPRELVEFYRLPLTMSLWHLAQRLKCEACGSRNVSVEAIPPAQYSHGYRMNRKSFVR
jgi:hypothetical protein